MVASVVISILFEAL